MKKIITSALVVGATAFGFSQEVKFGVKGGLNISHLNAIREVSRGNGDFDISTDSKTAFYIGGLAELPLIEDKLYGQVELQYTMNGGILSKKQQADFSAEITEFRFHQINIPVLAKYEIIEGLRINGGGYIGFNLLGQGKEGKNKPWKNMKEETDGEIKPNTLIAGLLIGTEYNFQNGFFIDARYNYELTNTLHIEERNFEDKVKNRFFQIGVGYKF